MRQGKRQALFYNAHDNIAAAGEVAEASLLVLLVDGWISKVRFFMDITATIPTVGIIMFFLVTTKTDFDEISGTQTMEQPFPTFATEDGIAYHGMKDMVPFPVLIPAGVDVGNYYDLELNIAHKVDAGHELAVQMSSVELGGTNASGDVDVEVEAKQIISPVKWR